MWIFLNDAFFSVVRPKGKGLLVRARIKGDIQRHFPKAKVTRTPNADYLYRAMVPQQDVMHAMTKAIRSIDYDNFKDSIVEDDRHDACLPVWNAMHRFQEARI